jgi:hypothetical protein
MSQQGGKVNKSLKDWVSFVKKVQKEEKLSYKDAISRAKERKDKGEKWMSGGATPTEEVVEESLQVTPESEMVTEVMEPMPASNIAGGKRTRRRSRARGKARARRSRSARRSRGRGRH